MVSLALVAAACSRAGTASGGRGTFRMAIDQPATLDPPLASSGSESLLVKALFDGLVSYDPTTEAVMPDVATSWDVNPANTVFTFHLRTDARFSDGERVTAASFVRGMTRALSPAIAAAPGSLSGELDGIAGAGDVTRGRATTLSGARALGTDTLRIHLSAPDAEFLIRCGDTPFFPVPSPATVADAQPSWADSPVGDGPFALAPTPAGGWLHSPSVVLVPNRHHPTPTPHVAEVVARVYPSTWAGESAWDAGAVDWAPVVPTATAQVEALGKKSFIEGPLGATAFLAVGLGALAPPTSSAAADVREAFSRAIDRPRIAASVFGGSAAPAVGLVPPTVPGSASTALASPTPGQQFPDQIVVAPGPGAPCTACAYDPAQARRLLAAARVALAGRFPLYYAAGVGEDAWMQAVAGDLRVTLGIDAQAVPVAVQPRVALVRGEAAAAVQGPTPAGVAVDAVLRYPTPDAALARVAGTGGDLNLTGFSSPALDASLAAARAITRPAARASAYTQAERDALATLPVIPLFWPGGVRLARLARWSGLGMDPFGDPTLRTVALRG
ncbi:MAG TPA: ABC transporter substrate-binding protein [Actinomycetota bacterium]|nr:ABC transporter substrate-binding protein [Actinomycetota bacterium]